MQKYQNIQLLCSCNYKIVTKNSKQVRKCVQFFYIPCLFYLFPQQNFKVMCEILRDERGMNVEMQIHDLPGQRAHCVNPLNPWNSFDVPLHQSQFCFQIKVEYCFVCVLHETELYERLFNVHANHSVSILLSSNQPSFFQHLRNI